MLNLRQKPVLLALTALSMALTTATASAASSATTYAEAAIDWSTFTITGYGFGSGAAPSYSLNGQSSYTSSNISDWLSWSADTDNNRRSFAASTEGNGAGNGSASANRSASLSIFGSGFLLITADYILSAAINGSGCGDYSGYCYSPNFANATVGFNLSNTSSNGNSHSSSAQQSIALGNSFYYPYTSGLNADNKQGRLAVGVIVNNGDTVNFSASVSAAARENSVNLATRFSPVTAVPLPSAVWLFSSAAIGMLGLSRRKTALLA